MMVTYTMKYFAILLLATLFASIFHDRGKCDDAPCPLRNTRQIVVVRSKTWDAFEASMSIYEKKNEVWQTIKQGIPVVLGRNGLGWGRGFGIDYNTVDSNAPVKKEGDGRAPSGIFGINLAFGFPEKPHYVKLPYIKLTDHIECVDDVASVYYNRIIDNSKVEVHDWKSSEKMSTIDVYRAGVLVEHNTGSVEKGCGSCIFLHVWDSPDKPTSGCTAMSEDDLAFLIGWLDPAKAPLLLQFTEDIYKRIKNDLSLP